MSFNTRPFGVGQDVGRRYQTRRLLGAGGMGAVYEAWDRELGIPVALKVILPAAAADPKSAAELEWRFKRELLLARQVTHRNVVRIHDLGEIDGIKYITMPLISGTDLRSRLKVDGRLPVTKALDIARQVAAGLKAAHDAGVVHRDLKPANIMIDASGQALITDFGLARFTGTGPADELAPSRTAEAITVTAAPVPSPERPTPPLTAATEVQGFVGTLEYMAPEQARRETADHRTDIFAFGLILQEMLVGRTAIVDSMNPISAMHRRHEQPPVPLRQTDASIPQGLEAVVLRCLQRDRAARYQTTGELVAALDRLDADGRAVRTNRRPLVAAAAALVLVTAIATAWWMGDRSGPAAPPPRAMQIILASFANTSSEPGLESTIEQALGLTLEGAKFISVYPRVNATRQLAQLGSAASGLTEENSRLIAISQGLDAVLSGSIESQGEGFRIAVRTVDAEGKEMSRHAVEAGGKADLLTAVTRVASLVRDDLGDTTPESVRQKDMETFTTVSLDAVRDYLRAQELANANEYQKAIDLYHSALKHDPEFGRAYSGLAVTAFRAGKTQEADEAYKQAFARLDRMTEREKLRTLGAYYLQFTRNAEKAIENYRELVAKYPADRAGYSNLAIAHFNARDFEKAMEVGRLAIDAYPRDTTFRSNLALFAMYASDFKTAAAEGQAASKLNPQFAKAYLSMAISAIDAGDLERGRTAYERMQTAALPGQSLASSGLADLAMYSGRPADAIELLRRGLAEDETAKRDALVVAKQAALAEALEMAGDRPEARKVALALASRSKSEAARVSAALLLLRLGGEREAERIATELATELQPQRQAYGRIIEAELARGRGQHARAAALFLDARKSADLWLGRLMLGRTYLEAAKEAEALSELEAAFKRRGEATALFLDDYPTFRYIAPLHYWLGRANQALNVRASAQQHYEAFLRLRPETSKDPLAADARKRLGVK